MAGKACCDRCRAWQNRKHEFADSRAIPAIYACKCPSIGESCERGICKNLKSCRPDEQPQGLRRVGVQVWLSHRRDTKLGYRRIYVTKPVRQGFLEVPKDFASKVLHSPRFFRIHPILQLPPLSDAAESVARSFVRRSQIKAKNRALRT